MTFPDGAEGPGLNPTDWDAFRHAAHDLLERCIDRIARARNHP